MQKKIILATGLWDIGRGAAHASFARSYDHYLESFKKLLRAADYHLVVFGEAKLADFVFGEGQRSRRNTEFIPRGLEWLKSQLHHEEVQKIRIKEAWLNQAGWLKDSPQAALEYYNTVVMSKPFLLHDAVLMSQYKADAYYWLDAGIANTVNPDVFKDGQLLSKLDPDFLHFIKFPYRPENEIHGFDYKELKKLTKKATDYVVRGGFFGGGRKCVEAFNHYYYTYLNATLIDGLMGTEESVFTILAELREQHAKLPIKLHTVDANGLIAPFFERLKHEAPLPEKKGKFTFYALSYNSPSQFRRLCETVKAFDPDFFRDTRKVLINNSDDYETLEAYDKICAAYGFEEINKNNIGICGGRQFAAEHFEKSDSDYMVFFEDDMTLKKEDGGSAFKRYVPNLFDKAVSIMQKEELDYLKLSMEEFYGDNFKQWGWINLPDDKRKELYPHHTQHRSEDNLPETLYWKLGSHEGLPYAIGEPHYSNWPLIFNKSGNKKVFLDTVFKHPFEQTWCSFVHQMQKAKLIKCGTLLLSPVVHDRFDHYPAAARKEN